ncbi:lipid-A-disaccharide synthase [Deltaproteobacteria bacterium TL4]
MKLLIVAGEASGDTHGASLIQGLKQHHPDMDIYGIGGPKMLRAGLRPYYTLEVLQVNGFIEVLRHLPRLYRVFYRLCASMDQEKPDAVLLVDYPGFNLKLAIRAKRRDIPVIFFNSPQIWAWRKKRLQTIVRVVDLMIVLLPFEEAIYQEAGVNVRFVGHPLLDEQVSESRLQQFKKDFQLEHASPIITIAPGSRPSEIERHLPVVMQTLSLLGQKYQNAKFLVPVAETLNVEKIRAELGPIGAPVQLVQHQFLECLHAADVAIVSSGTATLQTGLSLTPFVIIYRVSSLSFWIAKKLAQISYLGLVNILADRLIIPELLQKEMTPARIVEEVAHILSDSSYRDTMVANLKTIRVKLGESGAYGKAVLHINTFLKRIDSGKKEGFHE